MAPVYLCSIILLVPLAVAKFDPSLNSFQVPAVSKYIPFNDTSSVFKELFQGFLSNNEQSEDAQRVKRETGRFNSFYEYLVKLGLNKICRLLRRADIEDLLVPLGSFTLFAPTDEAFALLPGGVVEQIESNPDKLRDFLAYHIAQGQISSKHIQNDVTIPSITGRPLRFNIYVTDKGEVLSVSGGQIVTADHVYDRNIVHVLDRVLYPSPSMDISTVIRWTHDRLYRLLLSAGIERKLSGGIYTLFAPSDDAFKGLPQASRELLQRNITLLSNILLDHIVPGAVFTTALYDGLVLTSVGGSPLTFSFRRGLILVNGIPIVEPDIPATNGVIHVVNRVLVAKEILTDCHCLPDPKTVAPSIVHEPVFPSPPHRPSHPTFVPTSIGPHGHHITILEHRRPAPTRPAQLPRPSRPEDQQRIDEPGSLGEPSGPFPEKPSPHHDTFIIYDQHTKLSHKTEIPFGQRKHTIPTKPYKPIPFQPPRQPSSPSVKPTPAVLPPRRRPPTTPQAEPPTRPQPIRPPYHHTFPSPPPFRPPVPIRPPVEYKPALPSPSIDVSVRRPPAPQPEPDTPRRTSPPTYPTYRPQTTRFDYHTTRTNLPRTPTVPAGEHIYIDQHNVATITDHHIDIISPVVPETVVLHDRTRPADVPRTPPPTRPTERPTTTTKEPEPQIDLLDVFEKPELVFDNYPISLQIIYRLIKEVGLSQTLVQPGPVAVFVPSDDVLTQLPEGTLKELRHNPDLLHQVLLYHVITVPPPPFDGPSIHSVRTAQGLPALIRYDVNGRIIQFDGVDVITSRGVDSDHVIYVTTRLVHPLPKPSINAYLSSRRDIYRYFAYLVKSSIDEVIKGPELFTLFLPTDESFDEIPRYQLDQILNNRTVLEEFLLNHVVPGVYFTRDLKRNQVLPSLRGGKLRFKVSPDGSIKVNDGNIVEPDVFTGNGVIHVIDRLLYIPPYLSRPRIPSAPSAPQTILRVPSTRRPLPSQVPTTTFDLSRPSRPPLTPRPSTQFVADPYHHVVDYHIISDIHPITDHRPAPPTIRTQSPQVSTLPPDNRLRPDIDVTITEILQKPELVFANQPFSISISYELFKQAGLTESLSSKGPFTIFIPTDDALNLLPRGELDNIRKNPDSLRQILLYHMIAATLPPTDTRTTYMVTTAGGKPILLTYDEGGNIILVDGVEVVTSKVGNNGAIYVITKLLYPLPEKSIIDYVQTRRELTSTLQYLINTGIDRTFRGPEPFTFFAPSNDAFQQLSHEELQHLIHNKTALERFLLNHVVGGIHYTKELQPGIILPTPRGSILRFHQSREGRLSVNGANIIESDITTGTGVVHIIDNVIRTSPEVRTGDREPVESVIVVPPGTEYVRHNIADLAKGMGLNKFVDWLVATDLIQVVQDGKSYTIFAPTDEAINSLPGLQSIEKDPNQLRGILKYHIAPVYIQTGKVKNDDLVATLLEGKEIRFNIYQDGQLYTASGAPFAPPSNPGNVLIAVVDRVLFPPQGDIYTTTTKLSILKELKKALESSGLQDILQGAGPFTFFAPSNEAFDNLSPEERQKLLSNPQALQAALKRHIVKGDTVYTSGVREGLKLKSSTDEDLTLSLKPTCVAVDGINVVYPDITAFNGVIHIIDHFL